MVFVRMRISAGFFNTIMGKIVLMGIFPPVFIIMLGSLAGNMFMTTY